MDLHHECGVLGLYNVQDPATKAYYGLYSLQHRGQESAGIYVSDREDFLGHKNFGMVRNVFDPSVLAELHEMQAACHAIGHVRYAAKSENIPPNLQPMYFRHMKAEFVICSNGSLINHEHIGQQLQEDGRILQSSSNCELLAHLIVKQEGSFVEALKQSLTSLVGSFCYVILRHDRLYAIRDPHGFMPLALGRLGDGYVVSSESCAFELLGADFVRDVEPGEMIEISPEGLRSYRFSEKKPGAICLMEYIYFARPDSDIDGVNVHLSRYRAGMELARESAVPCDLVVGVPESSLSAARGYAVAAGLPYDHALIKNKYSGRSFIESTQERRDLAVYLKLSPIRHLIQGKSITLVDDSIVRGTTSRQIIQMMRRAGAREVHMRIASPQMIAPCFYGVDTSSYEELIGSFNDKESIRRQIGADSLEFVSIEGLRRAVGLPSTCDACFTENYPTPLLQHARQVRSAQEKRRCQACQAR